MKRILPSLLILAATLMVASGLQAAYKLVQAPLADDPMQVSIYQLDNGLTVYLSENHESPTFRSEIVVRSGSRDDPADATGLAHYLEHLMFKGSQTMGTIDWEKEKIHIDKIYELYEEHAAATDPEERAAIWEKINEESMLAAQYAVPNEIDTLFNTFGFSGINAYTASDRTVFLEIVPANRAEQWAMIESARFTKPVFRLFQTELEIVYEEKNRSLDNKQRIIQEELFKQLYGEHPYGSQTALGSIEDLKNPRLQRIKQFVEEHYVANNMAIVISGDIEKESMMDVIDRHFSHLPHREQQAFGRPMPKPLDGRVFSEVSYPGEEMVMLGYATQALGGEDVEALKVLDMILSNAQAGLIDLNLNQQQKVVHAGSFPYLRNDAGSQFFYAIPKQGQTCEEAEQLLLEQIELVKQGKFEDWILPAIVADFKKTYKASLEDNTSRAGIITESFSAHEDWATTVQELDRIEQITKADIIRVAQKYFNDDYAVVYRRDAAYSPPKVEKPALAQVEIDRSRRSSFAESVLEVDSDPIEPEFIEAGKDYQIVQFRPGVKIYYSPNPINDLFSLSMNWEFGETESPELAYAAGLLDKSGTSDLSSEDLKKEWYKLATNFNFSVSSHGSSFSIAGLDENLDASLALMDQLVSNPQADQDTLDALIAINLKMREDRKKDFEQVFTALRSYNRYREESPFLKELKTEEIQALKAEELLKLVANMRGMEHNIFYVGSLSLEELEQQLAPYYPEGSTLAPTPELDIPDYHVSDTNEVMYFNHATAQSQVRIEWADGSYDFDDTLNVQLFNEYFYGGMSGIVFQEMREARALCYVVWANYFQPSYRDKQNLMVGYIGTQADKTLDAIDAFIELFDDIPVSENRFESALGSLINNYRVGKVGFRDVLGVVRSWERLGIKPDPRKERFEQLPDATLEQVLEFHQDHIANKPRLFSILGPCESIDLDKLKELGTFTEVSLEDIFVD